MQLAELESRLSDTSPIFALELNLEVHKSICIKKMLC